MTLLANRLMRKSARHGPPLIDPFSDFAWHTASWASDPAWTAPDDGDPVTSLRNAGSSGYSLAEATDTPTYNELDEDMNNAASIEFHGHDFLATTTFLSTIAQPFSVVTVFRLLSMPSGSADQIVSLTRQDLFSGTSQWDFVNHATSKYGMISGAGSFDHTVNADASQVHMLTDVYNGGSSKLIIDGSSQSGTVGTQAAQHLLLGNYLTVFYNDIKIGFVGLIAGDITAHAHWADLQSDFETFYDI